MVGIRSPIGLVVGSCTSHPGVLGSISKREEPWKTGALCVKVPGSLRVPHPGVLGSIPKREGPGKTVAPCVKVPGSSRVPPVETANPWSVSLFVIIGTK